MMNEIEYSVEERDEYGQISVIEKRFAQPSSYLRDQFLRKMPKKQLKAELLLKQGDQMRLKQLFELPDLLEEARQQRIEQGKALELALTKVSRLPEGEKPEEKEPETTPTSKQAVAATLHSPSPSTLPLPMNRVSIRVSSGTDFGIWIGLTVFFFFMAYSHDAREFIKRKVIVDLIIDTIIPPLFDMFCNIGHSSMEIAPATSKTILTLYYFWKVWVSVGAVCYLYCKLRQLLEACALSMDTLRRKASTYILQRIAK